MKSDNGWRGHDMYKKNGSFVVLVKNPIHDEDLYGIKFELNIFFISLSNIFNFFFTKVMIKRTENLPYLS